MKAVFCCCDENSSAAEHIAGMHKRVSRDIIVNFVRRRLICIAPLNRYFCGFIDREL